VIRWNASPSAYLILSQDPKVGKGITEAEMKKKLPKTFSYLRKFEGDKENPKRGTLRGRALFKLYFKSTDPFYSMYNVGAYTLAPFKVVWREQSRQFQAAKVASQYGKPIIPDHKLMAVDCYTEEEADYLAALLGSSPCKLIVMSYAISTSTSTHVLEHLAIPKFDPKNQTHTKLAGFSKRCHVASAKGDEETVSKLEEEIDALAAELWDITDKELQIIQKVLGEIQKARTDFASDEDEE
jgi:hypothetical protein